MQRRPWPSLHTGPINQNDRYLPFRDFRFSLPRKNASANGDQRHWYKRDEKLIKLVLKRIATEGPLMAKDFEHTGKKIGEWKTKQLRQLFYIENRKRFAQRKSAKAEFREDSKKLLGDCRFRELLVDY